jgi:hypothetical protein
LTNTSFQASEALIFRGAKELADAVLTVVESTNVVKNLLPAAMVFSGNDDISGTTGITSSTSIFNGSNINRLSYSNLLITLQQFRSQLQKHPYFVDIPDASAELIRVVFTDSVKSVGFDSSKLANKGVPFAITQDETNNIYTKAFAKIYEPINLINDCHVGRREFLEAELAPNGISFIQRYSSTLKQLEDRAVIALKFDNKPTCLLAVSRPPKYPVVRPV